MFDTPIAFFVFNRMETTRKVFAGIRAARPRQLFIVADAPRAGRPEDVERCAEVRKFIDNAIDWPCEVRKDMADQNLGCARRVSSGIDWVFSQAEEAIILEDDCVPDGTFFPFCAELLDRYRDEPRIAQIAGCSFQPVTPKVNSSYYFSAYPHCWGWATWRRSWQHYDHTVNAWNVENTRDWVGRQIRNRSEQRFWSERFDAFSNGLVDSWAYRWTMSVWKRNCLSILPYQNLVSNIGFGPGATHTHAPNAVAARALNRMTFPLKHPGSLEPDANADDYTSRLLFRPPSLPARAYARLRRILLG